MFGKADDSMIALVTGGAGFIGSHLVDELLNRGCQVTVIDNFSTGRRNNLGRSIDKLKIVEGNVGEAGEWMKEFSDVSWVFHLAALADIVPSIKDPDAYFRSNVSGTFNVVQASTKFQVDRFIYAASSSSYGISDQVPTTETAKICPQYPYALTKHMGEEIVMHWGKVYGLKSLSLRFFNVYGPRARTSGTYGAVFGVFLAQKLANKPFTVVGDGEQTRDFTYVSDVVRALICAAESDRSQRAYNVGSGATVSVNRLVELLGGEKVHIPKRPGEPDCTFADISRIRSELGWSSRVALEEGVSRLLRDIEYWREAPVWTPDTIAGATKEWFQLLGSTD